MKLDRDQRQNLGIEKWKEVKGRGTCLYPTGFGKTRVALKTIRRILDKKPDYKVIVIVPTDYLKIQWTEQLESLSLLSSVAVKIVHTAVKEDLSCDLLVVDEVHMMMAETFSAIFHQIKYKMILCLTGTIDRLDGKQVLLNEYAPICDTITLNEAIENEWVADYVQYKVLLEVDLTEYKKQHALFLHYFSYFGFDFNLALACAVDFNARIQFAKNHNLYENGRLQVKEVTTQAMGFLRAMKARKSFIYDHLKKIEVADKIIKARENAKIITFTKTKDHAAKISRGKVYHGSLTAKQKAKMIEEFIKAESGVLNTCKAVDVGADLPGVNTLIVLSGDSSSITKNQRLGRGIRREGDKVAEIWHFVLKGTVEEDWYKKSSGNQKTTTIDEDQLDQLLTTGTFKPKKHRESSITFKF